MLVLASKPAAHSRSQKPCLFFIRLPSHLHASILLEPLGALDCGGQLLQLLLPKEFLYVFCGQGDAYTMSSMFGTLEMLYVEPFNPCAFNSSLSIDTVIEFKISSTSSIVSTSMLCINWSCAPDACKRRRVADDDADDAEEGDVSADPATDSNDDTAGDA